MSAMVNIPAASDFSLAKRPELVEPASQLHAHKLVKYKRKPTMRPAGVSFHSDLATNA